MTTWISEPLVPDQLIVGPEPPLPKVTSLNELKDVGVEAIVDLNQDIGRNNERKAAEKTRLEYVLDPELYIEDEGKPIPVRKLEYVTEKIHRLISQGKCVYLHCTGGLGRSPTVAAAYLIRYLRKNKKEAMLMVKEVRRRAWDPPDDRFLGQLSNFEGKYSSR